MRHFVPHSTSKPPIFWKGDIVKAASHQDNTTDPRSQIDRSPASQLRQTGAEGEEGGLGAADGVRMLKGKG